METDARDRRLEIVSALLLALATVGAAWSGYQSARWSGVQATDLSSANAARLEATRASTAGGQLTQIDVATFLRTVDAFAARDDELVAFYVERMRPEFRPVFDAWVATDPRNNSDAPLSPFELEGYSVSRLEEAELLSDDAEAATASAREANSRSKDYTLTLVLYAAALFFAGMSTKFHAPRARTGLLVLGAILFLGVSTWVAVLPKSVSL